MKRRSAGEGTLYYWEKKNLWVGKLTMPDGKRRTKYAHTQKEVKDWLLTERGKLSQGIYISDDKITVAEFMNRYLEDYCKRRLQATTLESYTAVIKGHIIPDLGNIRLIQLNSSHLNQLYTKKLDSGLSNRWVEYIHGVLKRSLNTAIRWGLLTKNPTDFVTPPAVKFRAPSVWTSEQVKKFLAEASTLYWWIFTLVGLTLGVMANAIYKLIEKLAGHYLTSYKARYEIIKSESERKREILVNNLLEYPPYFQLYQIRFYFVLTSGFVGLLLSAIIMMACFIKWPWEETIFPLTTTKVMVIFFGVTYYLILGVSMKLLLDSFKRLKVLTETTIRQSLALKDHEDLKSAKETKEPETAT